MFQGGYYSDDVGYVATNCKKCPNGSFVAFDKAPGTRTEDCKSCPQGKAENSIFGSILYEQTKRFNLNDSCLEVIRSIRV